MDWDKAVVHFYKVMNEHNERCNTAAAVANANADSDIDADAVASAVAAAVAEASTIDFLAMLRRFEKGERTQELHDEMMAVA